MADLNSIIAYPFTKSLRDRDKIMSEVQLAKLHLAMVDGNERVILSKYDDGSPKEILLHGYYFLLNHTFASTASRIYIYIEQDQYDTPNFDQGAYFPELLQSIGGSYPAHECVFNVSAAGQSALRNSLGLTLDDQGNLITSSGNPVIRVGGDPNNFVTLDSLYEVYYLSDTPDNTKTRQIWIKTKTTEEGTQILNPYIYYGPTKQWMPLGAVYKED